MKNLCLLSLFLLAFAVPRVQAITNPATEMASFQSALSNTLFLATNEVASPDKKAVAALKRALVVLGKADVENIASDAKALSSAVGTLSRSSVSNSLHDAIGSVMEYFYFVVMDGADSSSNRLNGAFPSGTRTAAARNLALVYKALLNPSENGPTLAKAIAAASKKLAQADKLVDKALAVPAPKGHFTATIDADGLAGTKFSPSPAPAAAALTPGPNLLTIVGINVKISGRFPNMTTTSRYLTLVIPGITDGTTTYNVAPSGEGNAQIIYTWGKGTVGGSTDGGAYNATSGSITVTINTAAKSASGTFNFSAPEQDNASDIASSSDGSFSVTYQ